MYALNMKLRGGEAMETKIVALIVTDKEREEAFPYNKHWQTACLPISNQPNIQRTVELLDQAGIEETYVLNQYLPKQVQKSLKDYKDIHYVESLEAFSEHLPKDTYFFYIKGNRYIPDNLFTEMTNQSFEKADGLISVSKKTKYKNASNQFGIRAQDEFVKSMYGYTREHYMDYYTSGIYLLNQRALDFLPYTEEGFQNVPTGGMPSHAFHIENLIQETIQNQLNYQYVVSEETVYDLKYPWELMEANIVNTTIQTSAISETTQGTASTIHPTAVIEGKLQLGKNITIVPNVLIKGNANIGDHSTITTGAILEENVIIGSNTVVSDYAKIVSGTTIGNHCKVGYTAEVNGVFFDGVSAVHNSEFFGIAGKSVDIAAACNTGSLRFDDQEVVQKIKGKRYAGKYTTGVFIGDYTRLGIGNLFYPGVKVGSYSAIGPGAIITKDVPENTLVQAHQEITTSHWGPERYGWND